MDKVTLTASMRANLLSLQNTQSLMDRTQNRLATGLKVNSAIDNPSSYYTAKSLSARASDLSSLLDSMDQAIQTVKAATVGIEKGIEFLEQATAVANQALEQMNANRKDNVAKLETKDLTEYTAEGYKIVTQELVDNGKINDLIVEGAKLVLASDITLSKTLMLGATSLDGIVLDNITFNGNGHTITFNDTAGLETSPDVSYGIMIGANERAELTNVHIKYTNNSNSYSLAAGITTMGKTTLSSVVLDAQDNNQSATATTFGVGIQAVGEELNIIDSQINYTGNTDNLMMAGAVYSGIPITISSSQINTHFKGDAISLSAGVISEEFSISDTSFNVISDKATASTLSSAVYGTSGNISNSQIKTKGDNIHGIIASSENMNAISVDSYTQANTNLSDTSAKKIATVNEVSGASVMALSLDEEEPSIWEQLMEQKEDGYQQSFQTILQQYDMLVADSSYKGVGLLRNESLNVVFNEDGSSVLEIEGTDASSTNLGILTKEWTNAEEVEQSLSEIRTALNSLRSLASQYGSYYSIVTTRQSFTEELINTLTEGADKVTLADMNEEAANMLSLQTGQQLAINSLSLSSKASQEILKLF